MAQVFADQRAEGTSSQERSALLMLVAEAEPCVGPLRARFDPSAQQGLPAHITLLYPFFAPDAISDALIASLRARFAQHRSFSFALTGLCGFPGVAYLRPDPLEPFDALIQDLSQAFPAYPPYGGAFPRPMPHLTVAHAPVAALEVATVEALGSAGPRLPLVCLAAAAALFVKRSGRWQPHTHFAFATPCSV